MINDITRLYVFSFFLFSTRPPKPHSRHRIKFYQATNSPQINISKDLNSILKMPLMDHDYCYKKLYQEIDTMDAPRLRQVLKDVCSGSGFNVETRLGSVIVDASGLRLDFMADPTNEPSSDEDDGKEEIEEVPSESEMAEARVSVPAVESNGLKRKLGSNDVVDSDGEESEKDVPAMDKATILELIASRGSERFTCVNCDCEFRIRNHGKECCQYHPGMLNVPLTVSLAKHLADHGLAPKAKR